jgi:hypothetical protein
LNIIPLLWSSMVYDEELTLEDLLCLPSFLLLSTFSTCLYFSKFEYDVSQCGSFWVYLTFRMMFSMKFEKFDYWCLNSLTFPFSHFSLSGTLWV